MRSAVTGAFQKLLGHLDLQRVLIGTQNDSDFAEWLTLSPAAAGAVALVNPNRLTGESLARLGDRLAIVGGDAGVPADSVARAAPALPSAHRTILQNYFTAAWTDVMAERGPEILAAILPHWLRAKPDATHLNRPPETGNIAGLQYRLTGQGPALILFPFLLSATQWQPVLEALEQHFTVIRLSGPLLGMVAVLQSRGEEPGHVRAVRALVHDVGPLPGERLLDVGCGTGILDRLIAKETAGKVTIEATDVNTFLLEEARALTPSTDILSSITYAEADAENLPYRDAEFDRAISFTVMEECNAARMLAEMIRVTRPGGRIGILVRAIDLPGVVNVDVPPEIKAKMQQPYPSVGEAGCADAGLYRLFAAAGLQETRFFPFLTAVADPASAMLRYREAYYRTLLTADEQAIWDRARAAAIADGSFLMAFGVHCASGMKPSA